MNLLKVAQPGRDIFVWKWSGAASFPLWFLLACALLRVADGGFMRQNMLRAFLRNAMLSALPLTVGCCPPGSNTPVTYYRSLDGGLDIGWEAPDGGPRAASEYCNVLCQYADACREDKDSTGQQVLRCDTITNQCIGGRRPDGLRDVSVDAQDEVGRYFAHLAHLEAASVIAFERMAIELERFVAPGGLVRRSRAAARDEIRHAKMTAKLAVEHNGCVPPVMVAAAAKRSRVEFAAENMVEGCVLETYGALLASFQGVAATDARVRAAMRTIAADETGHAELAWDVAMWAESTLSDAERRTVRAARDQAVASLAAAAQQRVPEELRTAVGLPSREIAARWIEAARAGLWT
jgi:hypothetical protein